MTSHMLAGYFSFSFHNPGQRICYPRITRMSGEGWWGWFTIGRDIGGLVQFLKAACWSRIRRFRSF